MPCAADPGGLLTSQPALAATQVIDEGQSPFLEANLGNRSAEDLGLTDAGLAESLLKHHINGGPRGRRLLARRGHGRGRCLGCRRRRCWRRRHVLACARPPASCPPPALTHSLRLFLARLAGRLFCNLGDMVMKQGER